jgi:hypothetical protein
MSFKNLVLAALLALTALPVAGRAGDEGTKPVRSPEASAAFTLVGHRPQHAGVDVSFVGNFTNLRGRDCKIVSRLCTADGRTLAGGALAALVAEVAVVPERDVENVVHSVKLARERIESLYGESARTVYLSVEVVDVETGEVLQEARVVPVAVRVKPMPPLAPAD